MAVISSVFYHLGQCVMIPKPTFTEEDLPDQTGRVAIVTGGYAGVGKELVKILYSKGATIYIAGRAESKYDAALTEIQKEVPKGTGHISFLELDLSDMTTIKASADAFLVKEKRLDVLTNNAGVMEPPAGSMSAQNYELTLGTNVLGPWLFTHYLTPILQKTAATSPKGSVRVTWAGSLATAFAPRGGVTFVDGAPKLLGSNRDNYAQSKACNFLLAREFQNRFGKDGVVSNAWNPGNLKSELQRHLTGVTAKVIDLIVYEVKYGAYTELFAGWAPEAGEGANAGKYIIPWGRVGHVRSDLETGEKAPELWEWCEKESKPYLEKQANL